MTKLEKINLAKAIEKYGDYPILSLPHNKLLKLWATKSGDISKLKVHRWVKKFLNNT